MTEPPTDPGREARRWVQRNDTRLRKVIDLLEANLGVPQPGGEREGLQVLVLTILSQNTTDPNALRAYERLLRRFPPAETGPDRADVVPRDAEGEVDSVEIRLSHVADSRPSPDWAAVREAPRAEVEDAISVCGLQQSKAKAIQGALEAIEEETGTRELEAYIDGLDPTEAAKRMTAIPGIGAKTAAVTLMEAYGTDICPVDTHVFRVVSRLRLVRPTKTRNKAFRELNELVPEGEGYSLHHNLITFGRSVCSARNPACDSCFLQRICSYYRIEQGGEDLTLKYAD